MAYIPGRQNRHRKREEEENASREKKPVKRVDIDLEKLSQAYEQLGEIHKHVRESHIEMIMNLAMAAEYKDPDTGNHILRISDYATEVGKALGLAEEEQDSLRYASPMHDIGKIGIPDRILQKPGKLTPEEWEVMKTHTIIGSRIFKNSKSPMLLATSQIALTHHEKFDGSGYPEGLKGESIPLFGRIVAMVDVFDAIVSKRVYKSASSFREGMEYIESIAGTHLDPKLVKLFMKIEKEVSRVYEANSTIQKFITEFGEEKAAEF